MRRNRLLLLAILVPSIFTTRSAAAQYRRRPAPLPRAWVVLSDGIGITGGGVSKGTGLSQLYRVSGVLNVANGHGVEVSAVRIQPVVFDKPLINTTQSDGLAFSYASLSRYGPGLPVTASIGGVLLRRPTADPDRHILTGGGQLGFESSFQQLGANWADLSAGARVIVMSAGNRRLLYLLAITFGVRLG
jgi:hypothetical protein